MSTLLNSAVVPAALTLLGLALSLPAAAQGLDGTSVTGSLTFSSDSTNAFSVDTAVVSESQTEFSYTEIIGHDDNFDTADFAANRLVLTRMQSTDTMSGGVASTYTFTDPAFSSVTKLSDDFSGGLTYSLVGDTLTINAPAFSHDGFFTAIFHVDSAVAPVPEASSTVSCGLLLALGLAGLTLPRRKKPAGLA